MTEKTGVQLEETAAPVHLKRVLGLWDLVFYGIVLIQPIAAVGLFGIASNVSRGHMVTTLLIAMVGMMLTAISYGRMASMFPSSGSAYTYVGKGLNLHLGFLAGWVMFLDYLIIPVINTVYGALTLQRLMPTVPFFVWVVLFVVVITFLNLRGIRSTARSNELLLAVMCLVIGLFIVLAIRFIFHAQGWDGLLSYKPFYNPETFNFGAIMTATSFAALTYIGFDGVTTLAEEVKNPRRNMLLAPALVCLFTGLFSGLQIYLAQQVWPDYQSFVNPETAFFDVSARVGGSLLFNAIAIILFVACLGSGLAGQVGAARLLYAMGRDGVLPKKMFAHLDAKSATPNFNILFIAAITIVVSLIISYQGAAELLNFGAFLAFMGVNISAFRQFYLLRMNRAKRNILFDALIPLSGFLVCFLIWISLPGPAKVIGGIWLIIGLIYLIIRTRGLKKKPVIIDFKEA
ncbi:MAG: APC family permease [Prolixibacteraceae bacterium]|jgi:amino acid transporter|nr:APC family permease [Prolixibacteraceae bacterium]